MADNNTAQTKRLNDQSKVISDRSADTARQKAHGLAVDFWHSPKPLDNSHCTEDWLKGEHQPLVEPSTWEAVQSILKISPRTRANNTRASIPFLLKGIIEGGDGRAMTVAWTRKGAGKLYRYYLHTRENKEFAGASGLPRLPAIELEANVVQQLRLILRAPDLKTRVAQLLTATDNQADEAKVCIAMLQIEKVWDQLFPAEQERIVRLLIKKVVVTPYNIEVQFRPNGIERLAAELPHRARDAEEVAA